MHGARYAWRLWMKEVPQDEFEEVWGDDQEEWEQVQAYVSSGDAHEMRRVPEFCQQRRVNIGTYSPQLQMQRCSEGLHSEAQLKHP